MTTLHALAELLAPGDSKLIAAIDRAEEEVPVRAGRRWLLRARR